MTDQENLIQFSGCDENNPLSQGEITVFQKPGTPVIVHSILKASTRDNLIQLQTPVLKEPKRLKVHFETPSQHSSSLLETKTYSETEEQSLAGMDAIRDLDEKENWIERNFILTTMDHDDYMTFSKDILLDIIADMPITNGDEKHKEVNEQGLNTEGRWDDSKKDGIASQSDDLNSQFKEKKLENSDIEMGTVSNMTESSDNEKTEHSLIRSGAVAARVQNDSDMQPKEEYYIHGKRDDILDFESGKEAENMHDKAVSSDDEFLSADEDLPEGEKVNSHETIDPKRLHDFNFDDLDWLNPFPTKTTDGEAGVRKGLSKDHISDISNCNQTLEVALDAGYLSQPTHQIVNSTVGNKNPIQSESEEKSENYQTETDLLFSTLPRKQMPGHFESQLKSVSPSQGHNGTDDNGPIKSRKLISNISNEITNEHLFITKCEMVNSVDCSDNLVESVSSIANSPIVKMKDVAQKRLETSLTGDLPNKASKADNEVIRTSKPIQQLKSFSNKSYEPDLENDVDPFRPKKQLMNSQSTSDRIEEIDDVSMESLKPGKPSTNSNKPELKAAVIDPCKQSKQLINSFVITGDTEIDPFKTKKQLPNSPFASGLDVDPFKPSKMLSNSPVSTGAEVDPFKPSKLLSNSPVSTGAEVDPFKPSKMLSNSPVSACADLDPFKPSKMLSNSPVSACADLDPFKPSKMLSNSPVFKESSGNLEIYPSEPMTQLKVTPSKYSPNMEYLSEGDLQTCNTFSGISATEGPLSSQETAKQITCCNPSEQGLKMVHEDEDEDDLTVHTVAKRSQMDFPTGEQDFGLDTNASLDEAQFVPATEVFNDPAMLDMLEQFGRSENKTESTLSRISLYVKFDPLVKNEMGPANPRRISIRPKQLEKVKEFGLEESFLLLGTPPKRSKKPVPPRDPNVTPTGIVSTKRNKSVDMLFSISPEDQDQKTESCFQQPPCTPLLIGDDDCQDGIIEVLKYTEVDWKKMKRQMTLEFQGYLLNKEREWSQEMEAKTKASQKEIREAQEKGNKLQANIENLMMVLSEYEKMINTLIAEKETVSSKSKENIEEIKKERDEIKKERDQALEDLRSLDKFVSDFHRRYDKMKTALEGYVQNEAVLKKTAEDYQQRLIKTEKKLAVTKQDADKLEPVTKELEKVMAAKESEVSRLEAALKMKDLQISKLEQSLEQK
ncbi:hypothetical protein ACJMK2_006478, partial [Sinanodonta woodiana]